MLRLIVDYVLISPDLISDHNHFKVLEPTTISDHCALQVPLILCMYKDPPPLGIIATQSMRLLNDIDRRNENSVEREQIQHRRFYTRWCGNEDDVFWEALTSTSWKHRLKVIMGTEDTNTRVKSLQGALIDLATQCGAMVKCPLSFGDTKNVKTVTLK